jgi:hypothetical protein
MSTITIACIALVVGFIAFAVYKFFFVSDDELTDDLMRKWNLFSPEQKLEAIELLRKMNRWPFTKGRKE